MEIKYNIICPQEVKEKLLEWEKCGWITINHTKEDVQEKEYRILQRTHTKKTNSQKPKELIWCEQLKSIANKVSEELDNQTIATNAKGIKGAYIFHFDSKGFCKMMDELYKNHKSKITYYLHNTKKPIGVTIIFPFLGEIITSQIFNNKELQRTDLKHVFSTLGYKGDVAVRKLSTNKKLSKKADVKVLFETAKMLGKRVTTAK